jgi:hypothetical protein
LSALAVIIDQLHRGPKGYRTAEGDCRTTRTATIKELGTEAIPTILVCDVKFRLAEGAEPAVKCEAEKVRGR